MPYTTKIDFSDNRQVAQFPETNTWLSGSTKFGVPFSYLPIGPDLSTTAVTSTISGVFSTFSGNSGTTIYSWYDSRMNLATSYLSSITPTTSAATQITPIVLTGNTTGTTPDGYSIHLSYSGVSFDITPSVVLDLGGGIYSGSLHTSVLTFYSANTVDFTGRTIWADVSGITRTQDLIVSRNPTIGYVWTCVNAEGKGSWQTSGSGDYWSGSSETNAIVVNNSNSLASGQYSLAEGYFTTAQGNYSHAEGEATYAGTASHAEGMATTATSVSHSEGYQTYASGLYSHAEGYGCFVTGDYSHVEGYGTTALTTGGGGGEGSHAEGSFTTASGSSSHAEGSNTVASNINAHAEGSLTTASGNSGHAEGSRTTAGGDYSHAGGYSSIAGGTASFVHGQNSYASGSTTIVLGDSITGTQSNYTYVESLNVKTVGSSAFANDIRIAANGNLTTNTSDRRLKENIQPLLGSLGKIKQLSGVTYQWKDRDAGGDELRIGFIAQDVNDVEPLLAFTNKVDGYMGIHIDSVIPMLVEAVKELSSGEITRGDVYLETQKIIAEDNNIDLNYSGTQETAVGGGIRILHGLGEGISSDFVTDSRGNWITNNSLIPKELVLPTYTPTSSEDINGDEGNITIDDDFIYVKTKNKWKRIKLEEF